MSVADDIGKAEFYPTPAWVVRRLFEHDAMSWLRTNGAGRAWFEPCVGEGDLVHAVDDAMGVPMLWAGCDVRNTAWVNLHIESFRCADYLSPAFDAPQVYASIFNPPFSKALQFAAKARSHSRHVVMLQRRNWLTSALRQDRGWILDNPPAEFLLPERPSFVGGGTDSQEYEWFVWGGAVRGTHFLAPTPLAERRQTLRARQAQEGLAL